MAAQKRRGSFFEVEESASGLIGRERMPSGATTTHEVREIEGKWKKDKVQLGQYRRERGGSHTLTHNLTPSNEIPVLSQVSRPPLNQRHDISYVLVLYTGGTIGMFESPKVFTIFFLSSCSYVSFRFLGQELGSLHELLSFVNG